jgi:hypothetical protein
MSRHGSKRNNASIEKAVAIVKLEHDKLHANDGVQLFVFCALLGAKAYLYPFSAEDEDTAFFFARLIHAGRGLRRTDCWERVYPPEDTEK